ncbi:MAG TPA: aspartate--tRNA ligase [Bacteroidetes bacterium]|jgi:aspartyl-tRNA synthetase|nr:aspartate--tRNA ligase [Bacteroidota bacterium]
MHRTHTCGELRTNHIGTQVTLSGWVQRRTDFGALTFIDLRDRYGITQLSFNEEYNKELNEKARSLGREFVIKVHGEVIERSSKNDKIPTGHVEIKVTDFEILNASLTPPFTIEDDTDGGEEIRLKYRYLDLRRNAIQDKLILRSKLNKAVRDYLNNAGFIDVETPVLIKSTPEGARDFVVPSRMNEGQYYALPQSPQTFKQLLMVSGLDKYYQIVKCFRDEDFRADRQPEFTQIDCEMSFVEREDILSTFEGMIRDVFQSVKEIDLGQIPILTYDDAMKRFGSDKPDMRFGMELVDLDDVAKGNGFSVFDNAESIVAINVKGGNTYTRKELDAFTDWVKRPQIGALGLIYCRVNEDGSLKSSVDKFFDETKLKLWADQCTSEAGDLILVLSGKTDKVRKQMNELRLHVGELQGLRPKNKFAACWVVDFPLVEYDEESGKWHAMHHPFTSPIPADRDKMQTDPGAVKANAYDMAINGMEVGGGSIRIHDKQLQKRMFDLLGFTEEEAQEQFGFLMNAFEYGAPPHGGIAFGLDRLTAILAGTDSIRDVIAFPKNNMGRDIMIDAPAPLNADQKKELGM